MKVWIVEEGEMCEGGHIICVCSSLEAAKRAAVSRFEQWSWDDKREELPDYWKGGCDWLAVTEYEVED